MPYSARRSPAGPVLSAISYIGSPASQVTVSALTVHSNALAGDLGIAWFYEQDVAGHSLPTNKTLIEHYAAAVPFIGMSQGLLTGPADTFTCANTINRGKTFTYRGATGLCDNPDYIVGSGTTIALPALTLVGTRCWVFVAVAFGGNFISCSGPGLTQIGGITSGGGFGWFGHSAVPVASWPAMNLTVGFNTPHRAKIVGIV